jgi:hypothetical protein
VLDGRPSVGDGAVLAATNVYRRRARVKCTAPGSERPRWSFSCAQSRARRDGATRAVAHRDTDLSRHAVLILSADAVAAALLGAVVELAGHEPHFAQPDEAARDALRRVHPRLAVIDCDHEEACSDSFIGPALMTGAEVLLFAPDRRRGAAGGFARRLGLTVIRMPSDHEALLRWLADLRPSERDGP